MSPAPHHQRPLQAVVIAGTDLILVQQLVHHLLSHRGQTAGVQVEDDGTCKAVELLSPCTSSNMHSLSLSLFQVTCAHGPAELQQTLEGEIRDVRRSPLASGRVEVLLVAQPASRLLPETVPELIQLHVGLRRTRGNLFSEKKEAKNIVHDWWKERPLLTDLSVPSCGGVGVLVQVR